MGKIVVNVENGESNAYGTLLPFSRFITGEIIDGFNVTENSPVGLSVLIQAGSGKIPDGSGDTAYGRFMAIDADEEITITTPNGANPRIDAIVAYYETGLTSSGANNPNMLSLAVVDGTPAGSPSTPSGAAIQSEIGAGKPFIRLANVTVGASVSQITNNDIEDTRVMASVPPASIGTNAIAPGAVTPDKTTAAKGVLAYGKLTTNKGLTTSPQDIIVLGSCTVAAGRLIKITANTQALTGGANVAFKSIYRDGTMLNTELAPSKPSGYQLGHTFTTYDTPSGGSYVYKLAMRANTGSTDLRNEVASYSVLIIEDIGAA